MGNSRETTNALKIREKQTSIPILANLNTCLKALFSKFRSCYILFPCSSSNKVSNFTALQKSKTKIYVWKPQASQGKKFLCTNLSRLPTVNEASYRKING